MLLNLIGIPRPRSTVFFSLFTTELDHLSLALLCLDLLLDTRTISNPWDSMFLHAWSGAAQQPYSALDNNVDLPPRYKNLSLSHVLTRGCYAPRR
jgi:hypothetical protein